MNKIVSEIKVVVKRDDGVYKVFTRCLIDDGSILWFDWDWDHILDEKFIEFLNTEYAKLN